MTCINFFLIVARIRFQSSHYIVSEESPFICVAVENMAPPSLEDFAISYSYGKIHMLSMHEIMVLDFLSDGNPWKIELYGGLFKFVHAYNKIPYSG